MSRRSLIFCFLALAAMIVLIVAAVAFLYRDTEPSVSAKARYDLVYAVPSNAVMVCFLSDASGLASPVLSSFDFHKKLTDFLKSGDAGGLNKAQVAVSLHYSGSLTPLYIFDAGPASVSAGLDAQALMAFAGEHGYQAEFVNCQELVQGGPLVSRSIVLLAKTKAQLSIVKSHLLEGRSVMDVPGFSEAAVSAPSDVLFISYGQAKVLFEKAVLRSYYVKYYSKTASAEFSDAASFFNELAQWGVISLAQESVFDVVQSYDQRSDFMSVLDHAAPSVSVVSEMLPSYTRIALTLPMSDVSAYLSDYSTYQESAQKKVINQQWQDNLKKKTGIAPIKFVDRLGVSEVATASFMCDDVLEWVNLVKIEKADTMLLRGSGKKAFTAAPEVYPYAFAGNIASVFGKCFRLPDESHFTYMNGWLITGSRNAVDEYVSGMALSYDLKTYMADAGKGDLLADRVSSCAVYVNVPKGDSWLKSLLGNELRQMHDVLKGDAEYSPMVLSVFSKGGVMHTDLSCWHLQHTRSRAPEYERDTVVTVPTGPFKVINSGTGKINLFYQQSNGAICLKEEGGKGLWGVPFKKSLCGTAHNIDYYANGNKQILFGAGSELYLIDRYGRFVKGFPTDLGKEILLGPDVYDFNGVNAYNVLVLHKDNTIEMYNLRGKKPDSWKGITSEHTIKSLPERLVVGGKGYWVVRTSFQTLIFPFYGGSPITSFKGDQMFLPSAEIKVKNANTVEAECYDGKVRAAKLN